MRAMVGIALAAALLALPGCGTGISDAAREYLERQANPLDLEQPLAKGSIGNVDGYRVFLAGETHTKAKDKQAEKLLVRYFHEHEGVRYLLWETGFGSGLLLDRYLQTGSADELDFYLEQLSGTMGYTQEERDFWVWLREYNAALPDQQKLHVIGLDVDHQPETAARGLSLLADGSADVGEAFAVTLERALSGDVQALEELGQAIRKQPEEAQAAFGSSYGWAVQFAENFDRTVRYYRGTEAERSSKSNDLRDEAMMANFQFVAERYPQEAFFGELGSEHVIRSACETEFCSSTYNRFAMRLDAAGSPVAGAVCSILLAHTEQGPLLLRSYSPSNADLDYRPFEQWFGQDVLFSLDEAGSPFAAGQSLVNQDTDEGLSTTDYFQKMVLLSDSPDCTPLN
ncbi:hypothetical protein CE91St32_13520 [Gordonibacter pamelaeae]|uniref:erythromycin esterase family protein n=1 Tax=Gordonibacter urolithinfaciens TaxID=1335613 RepID=UPI00208B4EDB|nr:hypothetical protein CE91St32_13520 [Gordonibacter pamelaeae]